MKTLELRVLFCMHDAYGFQGVHLAAALSEKLSKVFPRISSLILTGHEAPRSVTLAPYVRLKRIPASPASYSSKPGTQSRSATILSSVKRFRANLVIAEVGPTGLDPGCLAALQDLRIASPKTRIVIALRDIVDHPVTSIPIFVQNGFNDSVRDICDQLWILGDRRVFDTVQEYEMSQEVKDKSFYTGYLATSPSHADAVRARSELGLNGQIFALIVDGGGEDGFRLLKSYAQGARKQGEPPIDALLLGDPGMDRPRRTELERYCEHRGALRFRELSGDLWRYVAASDIVVNNGDYPTVCEILALRKNALILPCVHPRKNRYMRSERLAALGLVHVVRPGNMSPSDLHRRIAQLAAGPAPAAPTEKIDLNGLARCAALAAELCGEFLPIGAGQRVTVVDEESIAVRES